MVFVFWFTYGFLFSQEYVDLVSVTVGKNTNAKFEGTSFSSNANTIDVATVFPIVIDKKNTFISGIDFSSTSISLFPESTSTNLYSTTLKIGLATTFSKKWSTTFVLLPKIASDYKSLSGKDFYLGGLALVKLQKKENLKYRFGFYASTEAFGLFTTPILGLYYKSPNKRFEIDASLPISLDINYGFKNFTLGFDYTGLGRSYKLQTQPNVYVEQSPLEFSSYFQINPFNKSFLIRAKLGITTNEHEVYLKEDTIKFKISAFEFGRNRNQLNPSLSNTFFVRIQAIYRFDIEK